jgi:hypothetical protein
MIHILSSQRRAEFLSGSCLARFEMCVTDGAGTPTLYIKSNIIDLYFVTMNRELTLDLINLDDDLIVYVIGIDEGEKAPLYLYSSIETLSEKYAIELIASGAQFDVIIFNDFAIEIARATGTYTGSIANEVKLNIFCPMGADYYGEKSTLISEAVNYYALEKGMLSAPSISLSKFESASTSRIISGDGNSMEIHGFNNATEVHELLPQIVGDHTSLEFIHSPSVEVSADNRRELSDAIIFGCGALLSLQAKCFDFDGETPPTKRKNAEKRMRKNVKKAIAQTKGSSRMIRERKPVFSQGTAFNIPAQTKIIFAIFIPALDLLYGELDSELADLSNHLAAYDQNLVVLDPMQFLRTVQAAEGSCKKLGCTADEMFFQLIETNSQNARDNGSYSSPILYRW